MMMRKNNEIAGYPRVFLRQQVRFLGETMRQRLESKTRPHRPDEDRRNQQKEERKLVRARQARTTYGKVRDFLEKPGEALLQKAGSKLVQAKEPEEIFQAWWRKLMNPELFTFGAYREVAAFVYSTDVMPEYARNLLFKAMQDKDSKFMPESEKKTLAEYMNAIQILNAMSPAELASNDYRVFTPLSIELIKEKANCTQRDFEMMLSMYEGMRSVRRTMKILKQYDRPLPKDFQELRWMQAAEQGDPSPGTFTYDKIMMPLAHARFAPGKSRKLMQQQVNEQQNNRLWPEEERYAGGDRWSTRPPLWAPHNWRKKAYPKANVNQSLTDTSHTSLLDNFPTKSLLNNRGAKVPFPTEGLKYLGFRTNKNNSL